MYVCSKSKHCVYVYVHCGSYWLSYLYLQSIRKRIRAKYSEVQQNKVYQENRRRFQELHHKLDYIKKQVVDYDRTKQ